MDEKRKGSKLTYKQIKTLILLIPTVTVGLWEYIRHEYLLPYISMDLGNWLTPVIVLFVTFTLLTRFFKKMECIQEELRSERAERAMLEERERIASELHDGLAQSLFLLSIKVQQLDHLEVKEKDRELFHDLKQNIHHIHDYVRQGINHLKLPPHVMDEPWLDAIHKQIDTFESESGVKVTKKVDIEEEYISTKEKVEISSCLGEALMNIHKHAEATNVWIDFTIQSSKKQLRIVDNGKGFIKRNLQKKDGYGIEMMQDRCGRIDWTMELIRKDDKTIVLFQSNS